MHVHETRLDALPVRAKEEKAILSKNEVHEDFKPSFTYPVSHSRTGLPPL